MDPAAAAAPALALALPEGARGPVSAADIEAWLRAAGARVSRVDVSRGTRPAADRLVVAGGDGAVGPAAEAAAAAGLPLAVVPIGTANDFARRLGIPRDPRAACALAVRGATLRRVDLGRLEGVRPFVNVASAGLAVTAARLAAPWRHAVGPAAYAIAAVAAGLASRPRACRVACDGAEVHRGPAWQAIVANTGAFGGGARAPADAGDGMLDVLVVPACSRLRLAAHARALRRGAAAGRPGLRRARGRVVEIELDAPGLNVDGDVVGVQVGRLTARPGAVEVVVS